MPIKINLLAEAQAAEDLRRRDPVKRFTYLGVLLTVFALLWSGMIEINSVLQSEQLTGVQTAIATHTNEYAHVQSNLSKIDTAQKKLDALQKLVVSRFLQGNLLNALQQTTVSGVALTRLRVEQSYFLTEGTDSQGTDARGRPSTVREKIVVTLDARDTSASPGDQVKTFEQAIADQPYFKSALDKTNGVQLTSLSALQSGPDGKSFVVFTVVCNFPEQTR